MQVWSYSSANINAIADVIKKGQVVACPTETAYGLLADSTNIQAVSRVFAIKGRSVGKVSALVVASKSMAEKYGFFSKLEKKMAKKYWPGPLTIIVKARGRLVKGVVKNKTVGMRVPGNVWLRKLIQKVGKPLTATSANTAGSKNSYSATQVKKDLGKRQLQYLVDGGKIKNNLPSTIVLVKKNEINILRQGKIKVKNI